MAATVPSTHRGTPSLTVAPTQNSAPVHEFRCLYTRDLHKKAKKWHDGSLRFHTFNRRVMVYDDAKNYIGDLHYTQEDEFGEGVEIQLDRGVKVEVGDRLGETQTDLAPILERQRPEKTAPQPRQTAHLFPRPQSTGYSQRPKSLLEVLGPSQGRLGRSRLSLQSPYEQRQPASRPDPVPPAAKKRKLAGVEKNLTKVQGEQTTASQPRLGGQYRQRAAAAAPLPLTDGRRVPVQFEEVLDISSDDEPRQPPAPAANDSKSSVERENAFSRYKATTFLKGDCSTIVEPAETPVYIDLSDAVYKRHRVIATPSSHRSALGQRGPDSCITSSPLFIPEDDKERPTFPPNLSPTQGDFFLPPIDAIQSSQGSQGQEPAPCSNSDTEDTEEGPNGNRESRSAQKSTVLQAYTNSPEHFKDGRLALPTRGLVFVRSTDTLAFQRVFSENDGINDEDASLAPDPSGNERPRGIEERSPLKVLDNLNSRRSPVNSRKCPKIQRWTSDTAALGPENDETSSNLQERSKGEVGPWTSEEAFLLFDWWPPDKEKPEFWDRANLGDTGNTVPPGGVARAVQGGARSGITTARQFLRDEINVL
ncbi:hypothetical protein ABEF95_000903 [Exophiala dermatitidis]